MNLFEPTLKNNELLYFAYVIKFRGYGREELLLLTGRRFKILSKDLVDGIYYISLIEQ